MFFCAHEVGCGDDCPQKTSNLNRGHEMGPMVILMDFPSNSALFAVVSYCDLISLFFAGSKATCGPS